MTMIDELNKRKRKYANGILIACIVFAAIALGFIVLLVIIGIEDDDYILLILPGIVFFIAAAVGTIIMIASRTSALKYINKYCKQLPDPSFAMARLEQTWQHGVDFKYGKIDDAYIILQSNLKTQICSLQDAVWVYGIRQSMYFIPVSSVLYVQYKDKKKQVLSIPAGRAKYLEAILDCIIEKCPQVYVGNDYEIGKLYKAKNWQELSRYAQMQRTRAE